MPKDVEPRVHTGGSRFTAAIGEGAGRGFRYGLLGAVVGVLTVPAAVAGIAIGVFGAGIGAAVAIGAVGGLLLSPVTMGATALGTIIGGFVGFNNGAKDASHRTGHEMEAARYVSAYNQTQAQIQNAMMTQMMQPEQTTMTAANDNPHLQASSKIDAATVSHENTVAQHAEKARV